MNDSPGSASPGSTPADGERPDAAAPERDPSSAPPPAAGPRWSKEQPPPGQWVAPGTPEAQEAPTGGPGTTGGAPGTGGPGTSGATGTGGPTWTAPSGTTPPGTADGTPGGAPGGAPGGTPGGTPGWGGPQQSGWGGQQPGQQSWSTPGGPWAGPAKPYAPKPGVIPLRPLSVGEILDGAVTTMRAHWRSVLSVTLAVAVVTQLAITLVQGFALDGLDAAPADANASPEEVLDSLGASIAQSAVAQVITLLGTVLATAMLTMIFSRAVLGKTSSVSEAWREARPRLLPLTGLVLLMLLMVAGILVVGVLPGILVDSAPLSVAGLLVALPVAVWLYVRFTLASPALMLERQGIGAALGRSARLVRGSWWRIFLIILLTSVITGIVSMIIVFPFTILGMLFGGGGMDALMDGSFAYSWGFLVVAAVGSVVALTITLPISAGVVVLLYIDQRIRREALDLELARAAGAPGPTGAPPGPTGTGS
ncbi:glycerophosphoryl diester phosphodiesterase membrane domain-containing protein [Streptomyces sp. NRRL S-87]|uniref:glycerophosphoryl diester phosphodiesterase membrane domain-containing protein n=1 Tax=Streptomyces sp. NRRL S-87 TaxID=1463920 RepID=UPI0004C0DB42|nr:glycerophosphoryl diester phosphodiesterase membrane domain-containing protein [Streptomyces sp. NRRL S-87]